MLAILGLLTLIDMPFQLVGLWEATIAVPGSPLILEFSITQNEDQLIALMDVPAQGAKGLRASKCEVTKNQISLEFKQLSASFTGEASADGKSIKGVWKQGLASLPCEWKSVTEFARPKRPQTPKPPFPYEAKEVTFENTQAKITLAGTLTLPPGEGPFPAVVLVSGSGPQDRDETLFEHKPFLVLADYLTRQGIAVLRYDDRGVGQSKGQHSAATSADFATDADAAIDYLRSHKAIQPEQIGIVGHSEGGMIGPMVAAAAPNKVAFLILLAGPGLPGSTIIQEQNRDLFLATGATADEAEALVQFLAEVHRLATTDDKRSVRRERLHEFLEAQATVQPKKIAEHLKLNDIAARESFTAAMLDPWMNYFLRYDPIPVLKQVRCRVLAVNGELDVQVRAKQNLNNIRKALEPSTTVEIVLSKGLNHLFQPCKTGQIDEYSKIEITFDESVMNKISTWIFEKK